MSIRASWLVFLFAWGCAHAPSLPPTAEAPGTSQEAAGEDFPDRGDPAAAGGEERAGKNVVISVVPLEDEFRQSAWTLFGLALVHTRLKFEEEHPGLGGRVGFHATVGAMLGTASFWMQKEEAEGGDDPLLDLITQAAKDDLIEEYALAHLARLGWWIDPGELSRLDVNRYLAWEREHVKEGHEPVPLVLVETREGSYWDPPPAAWLAGVDLGALRPCAEAREARGRLVARWFEEKEALDALPVARQRKGDLLPLLFEVRDHPRVQAGGVVLVSGRLMELLFLDGFCHAELGDYTAALPPLRALLELAPTSPHSYSELSFVLAATGRHEEAVRIATEGLSRTEDPCRLAHMLRQRGYSYIELGQLTLARHSYLLSLELQPDHELALNQLRFIHGLQAATGREEVGPRDVELRGLEPQEEEEIRFIRRQSTCPAGG